MSLIREGASTKEIAARLKLKVNTINTYRKNLMTKLQAKNSADLVRISLEQQL